MRRIEGEEVSEEKSHRRPKIRKKNEILEKRSDRATRRMKYSIRYSCKIITQQQHTVRFDIHQYLNLPTLPYPTSIHRINSRAPYCTSFNHEETRSNIPVTVIIIYFINSIQCKCIRDA